VGIMCLTVSAYINYGFSASLAVLGFSLMLTALIGG